MDQGAELRRRVLTGEIRKRQACREDDRHGPTRAKVLGHDEPPGFRRRAPRAEPRLGPFRPIIHAILDADRQAPKKPRHTAQGIVDRLREEHGYTGGASIVRAAGWEWQQTRAEVFGPLAQPPGEARADFGQAEVVVAGERVTAAIVVLTPPHPDAFVCCAFPQEGTETFQEGHVRASRSVGGVPTRISYDHSTIAVAAIVGQRGRTPTREFLRPSSHVLFAHPFCRVRRPNETGHVEVMAGFARRTVLVPVPEADSWDDLNRVIEDRCRADLARHRRGQPAPKQP
jgi:transposase